ncbi:MAG: TolC family protein, partial [Planctomycetota bacterium]
HRNQLFLPLIVALLITGCKTYEARLLIPLEILEEVEASRNLLSAVSPRLEAGQGNQKMDPIPLSRDPSLPTGFSQMARWMALYSPELQRARAEYEQAHSVAQIDTPLPNPEISMGPLIGTRLGPGATHKIQPAVDFGFSLPLNNRLFKNDRILQAKEEEAYVNLVVTHRKLYLRLRSLYIEWILSEKKFRIQEEVRDSSLKSLDLTNRMVKAGIASALDQGLMELESVQQEAHRLEAESRCIETEEELSRIMGVSLETVRAAFSFQLPSLEKPLPDLHEAKAIMVGNHPGLALLRARYAVAEKELCLAVAEQYPDLQLGTSYEGDPGDARKVWGLSIGIALPLFDRNQQGIAEAEAEREKVRTAYSALLNESLATLEGLYERFALANKKYTLLRDSVLPRSEANLNAALQSIRSGTIDSLKYLEVERTLRSLLIEVVSVEMEIRQRLNDVEQVMGVPLVLFPFETEEEFPYLMDWDETIKNETRNCAAE